MLKNWKMFFRTCLMVFFLFCCNGLVLAQTNYLQAVAKPGDGMLSFLRHYQLETYSCNIDKFCALNKVTRKTELIKGKTYFLPIQVAKFNAKNIRASLNISDFNTALAIQKYNELMLAKKVKPKSYKVDRELWVPHHILHCAANKSTPAAQPKITFISENEAADPNYQQESNPGKRKFPIFGPDFAYTPLLSSKLKGQVFYIDAGHGGNDPGAIGRYNGHDLCEDEYAYDVSLRLCRKLISHGATTYMITRDPNDGIRGGAILKCDKDEQVWGGSRVSTSHRMRLFQRSNIINNLYEQNRKAGLSKQVSISIHIDSRGRNQQVDLFIYHQKGSEEGKTMANRLFKSIKNKYEIYRKNGQYDGTVTTRDLHMLRETKPTALFLELGNIRHPRDQQRIVLESNREALAKWLFEGLTGM
jgi:N-acetylmuramoyl-L-alanine amidase